VTAGDPYIVNSLKYDIRDPKIADFLKQDSAKMISTPNRICRITDIILIELIITIPKQLVSNSLTLGKIKLYYEVTAGDPYIVNSLKYDIRDPKIADFLKQYKDRRLSPHNTA